MTVQWWSQAMEGWRQTATGSEKKPSLEEARCRWVKNSPQVHSRWFNINKLTSVQTHMVFYSYWWSFPVNQHFSYSAVSIHLSHSPMLFLPDGFKWPLRSSKKDNSCVLPLRTNNVLTQHLSPHRHEIQTTPLNCSKTKWSKKSCSHSLVLTKKAESKNENIILLPFVNSNINACQLILCVFCIIQCMN